MEEYIYQIIIGSELIEFYTFTLPELQIDQLSCDKLLTKGIVSKEILGDEIVEEYADKSDIENKKFNLYEGIVIKRYETSQLEWLTKTKEEAETILKDKILEYYQKIVPSLVNNVNNLQQEINKIKRTNPENNIVQNKPIIRKDLLLE